MFAVSSTFGLVGCLLAHVIIPTIDVLSDLNLALRMWEGSPGDTIKRLKKMNYNLLDIYILDCVSRSESTWPCPFYETSSLSSCWTGVSWKYLEISDKITGSDRYKSFPRLK